jgi:hypothetical protein
VQRPLNPITYGYGETLPLFHQFGPYLNVPAPAGQRGYARCSGYAQPGAAEVFMSGSTRLAPAQLSTGQAALVTVLDRRGQGQAVLFGFNPCDLHRFQSHGTDLREDGKSEAGLERAPALGPAPAGAGAGRGRRGHDLRDLPAAVRLEGDSEVVLVDFDVAQSFGREAGRSGRWVMRPVIHASDFSTASVIRGTVALGEGVTLPASCGEQNISRAHFVPTATAGEIVVSGRTEVDGNFRFSFVTPGSYTLGHVGAVAFDNGDVLNFQATVTPATLAVGEGENLTAAYTITGASCVAAS